jgi:hypothetical protein
MSRVCVSLALVLALASPALVVAQFVGVDFNRAGSPTPQNWNALTTAGSVPNLVSDAGAATGWSFAVTTAGGGFTFAADPNLATVPTHTYPLDGIDDYLTGNAGATGAAQFSNLPANTPFSVYAFGLRGFTPLAIDWTVSGSDTITFSQNGAATELWINGEIGSSARTLSSFARTVTSSATGTLDFTYDPVGTAPYAVAGIAIAVVPEPTAVSLILGCAAIVLRQRRRNGERAAVSRPTAPRR